MSLLLNASKIWSVYSDESTQYVRVKNNVANITNRQALIRFVLPVQKTAGMYNINMYGELKEVNLPVKDLMQYPDVDLMESHFTALKTICSLTQEVRHHLIEICRAISHRCANAVITYDRIKQPSYYHEEQAPVEFLYPFNMNPEIHINARYLEIVLLTFKDYPMLYVGRHSEPDKKSPLVIAYDWGNCAYIAPY